MVADTTKKTVSCDRVKRICCCQFLGALIFAIGLVVGLIIGIFVYHGSKRDPRSFNLERQTPLCPTRNPIIDSDYESSVFAPLTMREMTKAAHSLLNQSIIPSLDLPMHLTQTFITCMYLHPPEKVKVLNYLDKGGQKVDRYATVHVQRGAASPPDIMEFKVGPLGSDKPTVTPLTKEGEIHFNARTYDTVELTHYDRLVKKDMDVLAPLISESFDGAVFPNDLYIFYFNGPPGLRAEERESRFVVGFRGYDDNNDMDLFHLLPLSGSIHCPGTNSLDWYTYSFYYLNQGPYQNASKLMERYVNGFLRKVRLPEGFRQTIKSRVFPMRDERIPLRNFAHQPGSKSSQPDGPRYNIAGTKVSWMGWQFHIGASQMRGPSLFDVRFQGERIVYELSSSEIVVTYANDASAQNGIIYTDTAYGLLSGDFPTLILKDIDCPYYATVLNTSYWSSVTQTPGQLQSICIFEADGQEPLWRHNSFSFAAGLRNRFLMVRVPTVVGNYDYIYEFKFQMDGKLFTTVSATGNIQAAFWDATNPHVEPDKTKTPFGYRISDYAMGPIHDHTFGFKVDLDIINSSNTFKLINWKAGSILEALKTQVNLQEAPPYFVYNQTRFIQWETLKQEKGLKLNYDDQKLWTIVNEKEKNKWGVERGFQISPLQTAAQTLTEAHPAMKSLSFTKYHCAVTKRKEEEQHLTSVHDVNRMSDPKGHLDLMLDKESIVNEDLVTWITVGFLHVPSSEDVPMTTKVQTGFLLKPFNFFDRTASFDMPQYFESSNHEKDEYEPEPGQCFEEKPKKFCKYC